MTFVAQNDEKNIPPAHKIPPKTVVFRIPILSTNIPEIGDKKNVDPIVKLPTRAIYCSKYKK